ncbi:protein phosphatase 1L [Ischnura elegans]|uniref:protein phosphatase 1L n=1 Tax=Ischnura elegans TaxID=197161 RepID=UPI001ED8B7AE|nr:protein phosphatase 1L [Ischnura elegans]
MEDDLEDQVLYQTYVSHMKIISRFAVGLPLNFAPFNYAWKILRWCLLKPEFIVFGAVLFVVLVYLQAVDVWSRTLLAKLQTTIGRTASSKVHRLQLFVNGSVDSDKVNWELIEGNVAVYALQGARPRMEDRFVAKENIHNTGISLYAVFDGHGGEFAANYAKDNLMKTLEDKLVQLKKIATEGPPKPCNDASAKDMKSLDDSNGKIDQKEKGGGTELVRRKSSVNGDDGSFADCGNSKTDDCLHETPGITDPEILSRLQEIPRPLSRPKGRAAAGQQGQPASVPSLPPAANPADLASYLDSEGSINYGQLITDEVLAADKRLLDAAKKNLDYAGTTALIAILEGRRLVVANVGDSRGVLCDSRGNAIPLSFDHKPQQLKEQARIVAAGGFVSFDGVWRVSGVLATSRALGDYPLKDRRLVVAEPDVLSFDMAYLRPRFVLLASDGLWDAFSSEEAVAFLAQRLDEPGHGAASLAAAALRRGSLDNVTVLVVDLRKVQWKL